MRIAGLPLWAIVFAACATVPFFIQLWIDAEQRRAKERTRALLQRLTTCEPNAIEAGAGHAASIDQSRGKPGQQRDDENFSATRKVDARRPDT